MNPEQLRAARLAARLTPAELAALIGRSRGYVYHLERGRRRASLATIRALEDALNTTAANLGINDLPARHETEDTP